MSGLTFFLGFLSGIASSVLADLLWEEHGKRWLVSDRRWRGRRLPPPASTGLLRLGGATVPWLVVAVGPWDRQHIHLHYRPGAPSLHPAIRPLYAAVKAKAERDLADGRPAPFNGLGYKLEEFWVGAREPRTEDPVLELHFRPTDYYAMLATDQRLDEPLEISGQLTTLRQEFAARVKLDQRPVPEFATHWGIALQIVTADGYTFFSERGKTAVDAHVFFPSVAEGASRPQDDDGHGAPDPWRTAIRGTAEELGVEIDPDAIVWLSFGANTVLCEYGLIGLARTQRSAQEILDFRALGVPKDKWESAGLHAVRWTPEDAAAFVSGHAPWSPFALVALAHGLAHDFGLNRVQAAFREAAIRLSQNLPAE